MKLSDDDLQSLQDWAATGGKLDVDPNTKIEVPAEKVNHPRADVTLRADEPYQGSTDNTNDYRCFVLDPGFDQPTAVTGYEFVPDQKASVHHALVYRMSADSKAAVEQRDANDPGIGLRLLRRCRRRRRLARSQRHGGGADLVAGWAPGQLPGIYPDGAALGHAAGPVLRGADPLPLRALRPARPVVAGAAGGRQGRRTTTTT